MRYTFTLLVEFRGDMRGHEQKQVSEQVQEFASQQGIQTFSLEEGSTGTYAFMAFPDLIDERKDHYEIDGLRRSIELWLSQHQDIVIFDLKPITELSEVMPKVSSSNTSSTTDNQTPRDKLFAAISKQTF